MNKNVSSSGILQEFCIENSFEDKILFSIQFLFTLFLKITQIDEFLIKMHKEINKALNECRFV